MNGRDTLERELVAWFGEIAAPSTPDYTDAIVQLTAGRRQRPRWTFLERWLPMSVLNAINLVGNGLAVTFLGRTKAGIRDNFHKALGVSDEVVRRRLIKAGVERRRPGVAKGGQPP